MPVRLAALAALLVVLASGCRLDVAVDTKVHQDGTGVVKVAVSADDELLGQAPTALSDVRLDDLRMAGWTVSGPTREADGLTWVRLEKPFGSLEEAASVLQTLNGPQGPLHDVRLTRAREGSHQWIDLRGTVRLDGGIASFADNELVRVAGGVPFAAELQTANVAVEQSVALQLSVTLPGSVTAEGAVVEHRTATWTAPLGPGQATVLSARGEWAEDDPRRFRALARGAAIAAAVYLVLLVGFVAYRLVRSRR